MMSNRTQILRSTRGFTMLEILLALGLSGLVTVAAYSFYVNYNQQIVDLSENIEISTDIESGQRIILKDLKSIDPSFGVLKAEDDNNRPFFEYFPDVPESNLVQPTDRVITLKQGGATTEFVILLLDNGAHPIPVLAYDPSWAYQITNAGPTTEGTVIYQHVNWAQPGLGGHGNMISGLRGPESGTKGFWNDGQLLMFDTPSAFRTPAQMQERNKYAPRPPVFVGRVAGTTRTAPFNRDPEVERYVDIRHPITPSYLLNSANAFLWALPSTAGGMPVVRLRSVKLVKYYVQSMYPNDPDPNKKALLRLFRHVYTKGAWNTNVNHFQIAEKLKSVQFRRNSVGDKAVLFDISRSEL